MALTALLHAIQPLARLYGRFSSGLTPWRRRGSGRFRLPLPRAYAIWSERWRSAAHWLESIEKALKCQGAIVRRGGEFDYWDLEIRGGLSGSCRCQIAIEEHGSGTQLIRLRVRPKISVPAVTMTCVFGLLSALALADHAVAGSVMLGLAALVLGLHSLIDCAAAKSACHEAIGGIVQAADREASDISAGRNDQRQAVPQPDSKFDFADIEARSDFPSLPQRPVQKSEPLQQ